MSGIEGLEPLAFETTPRIIADRLRLAITSGALPPGTRLTEVQLSQRLAVSRGPMREAMQRLIQEGLLRDERHRGVFVVTLEPEDIEDIYFARAAAEHAAIRILIEGDTDAAVEALEVIVAEMERAAVGEDWSAVAAVDLRFHEALVETTGSKRLVRMFRTLMAETRMCLSQLESSYTTASDLVPEHRAIIVALRERDEAGALKAIDSHFASAVEYLKRSAKPT